MHAFLPREFPDLSRFTQAGLEEVTALLKRSAKEQGMEETLIDEEFLVKGKHVRPRLMLAVERLLGNDPKSTGIAPLCAGVELLHVSSLLHDDVIDGALLRRGSPSVLATLGPTLSVLAGDYLLTESIRFISEMKSWDVINLLTSATRKILQGEVLQNTLKDRLTFEKERALEIMNLKTASLFEAACQSVGVYYKTFFPEELAVFGKNFGMVFQMTDDLLDYFGSGTGKEKGQDWRDGKITYPVLALQEKVKDDLAGLFECRERPESFEKVRDMMVRHDVLTDCLSLTEEYVTKAVDALTVFPESKAKEILKGSIEACRFRKT